VFGSEERDRNLSGPMFGGRKKNADFREKRSGKKAEARYVGVMLKAPAGLIRNSFTSMGKSGISRREGVWRYQCGKGGGFEFGGGVFLSTQRAAA